MSQAHVPTTPAAAAAQVAICQAALADCQSLRNLLARLHGDGGHRAEAVGIQQAALEAEQIFLQAHAEISRLRNELVQTEARSHADAVAKIKALSEYHRGDTVGCCGADHGECGICAVLDCPGHEPLHYHHDGCPWGVGEEREGRKGCGR